MSTHKTAIDQDGIYAFVKNEFAAEPENFEVISGGEGSQAYRFDVEDKSYVIRINKHGDRGFKKDEYVANHFASTQIPVPKIHKIGKFDDGMYYCISEKVEGKILDKFSVEELEPLLPHMFDILKAIHATDISTSTGYGKWYLGRETDKEPEGEYESWKECLLDVGKFTKAGPDGQTLFDKTFLEKEVWDRTFARLEELTAFCPEDRYLIHGDYGFNNVLSDGKNITGVIDWEGSMYGDFLFDAAWLSFWSSNIKYQDLYFNYCNEKGISLEHYVERMLCYKLYVGLGSLSFYAYSGQEAKYKKSVERIDSLLAGIPWT